MSRDTRRILFYIFLILFLVLGTSIVLYSQGWRFDFDTGSFQIIGGIYLNSTPSNAAISLNGKPVQNQSSLLQAGTLISDLTPGKYKITVSEKGYLPWTKTATVISGGAAVFDKITLLPSSGSKKLDTGVSSFSLADGQLVTVENGGVSFQDHSIPGAELVATSYGADVITSNKSGTTYYLVDLSNLGSSLNLTALLANLRSSRLKLTNRVTIDKITFNPFDDSKVIINASDGLYIMDTSNLSISKVAPKTVADFTTSYDRLLWVNNSGISSYNLVLNSSTTIDSFATRTAILPDKINISSSGSLISVLDKSGRLYLFGSATQIPIVVADQVQASSFSPDSLYLAFGKSDGSVYVYDIDDDTYFNLGIGNGATINDIEWYKDSAHLFELQNNDLNFIEVATGTPVNSDLISNNVSQFNYSSNEDAVYYLANGEIFSFAITR